MHELLIYYEKKRHEVLGIENMSEEHIEEGIKVAVCHSSNFLKFLEDISPFCGATDTPVSDFW